MLTKYKHLVIFPSHPATLANYRKSFRPSGAKGDPNDAGLLLDLLTRHRERLRRINPDTTETRTLRFLVEERRKLVNERIRFSQRLNSHLKLYFPQVLNWFCNIGSQIAEEFLERWPTLEAVQRAKAKRSNASSPITIVVVPKRSKPGWKRFDVQLQQRTTQLLSPLRPPPHYPWLGSCARCGLQSLPTICRSRGLPRHIPISSSLIPSPVRVPLWRHD